MASPSIDDIHAEVDKWFGETIARPPISHDVSAYNQAHAAKADLKDRLTLLVTGKPAPKAAAEEAAAPEPEPASKSKPAA